MSILGIDIDGFCIWCYSRLYNQWFHICILSIYAQETTFPVHWSASRVSNLIIQPWILNVVFLLNNFMGPTFFLESTIFIKALCDSRRLIQNLYLSLWKLIILSCFMQLRLLTEATVAKFCFRSSEDNCPN